VSRPDPADPDPASPDLRPIFATAARSFVAVVATIRDDQWAAPGLGVWDVRALTGHALRAVTTCEEYLANPATGDVTIPNAGAYIVAALSTPGVHDAVAERGRQGGIALGDHPVAVVTATVERVVALVDATPLDTKVALPFGTIELGDYLPTRITEIVAHTDDLCRAVGHPSVATTDEVRVVLHLATETADAEAGLSIIRAVFGREPLPDGFNLWG
jgi:hypothetical protein